MRPRRLALSQRAVIREHKRMSAPPSGGGTPIENRRQLIEYFAAGNKPRSQWRLGTEHEKFGYHTATLKPLAYDGADGIRAMLEGLTRFGWEPVIEGNNPIALLRGKASITLEPGGQFELSGKPLAKEQLKLVLIRSFTMPPPVGIEFAAYPADLFNTLEQAAKEYLAATAKSGEQTVLM